MPLTTKSWSRRGAYIEEKPFPKNFRTRYNLFADCMLLGLLQGAIFTWFECMDAKGFSSGTGDGLRRMSEYNLKVIDILLG